MARAPPVHGLFFLLLLTRFSIPHATITKKRTKKSKPGGLLFTSRIVPKSGLGVTPLCREATRIDIELERLHNRLSTRSTSRAPRPSPWRRHVTMNIPVEREEGRHVVKTDPLCCFRQTFRRESWLILESVCLSFVAEETFVQLVVQIWKRRKLLPCQAIGLGAPQMIIRRPLPSPHLTGTITRYTQGVLVGASHLPLASIYQVTDFTFANFTQASSHAWSITYSSIFLTDL